MSENRASLKGPQDFLRAGESLALSVLPDAACEIVDVECFIMAKQEGTALCWAAVAHSVARFYQSQRLLEQCEYARLFADVEDDVDCCSPGSRDADGSIVGSCNQPCHDFPAVLAHAGNLVEQSVYGVPNSIAEVRDELKAKRVVVFEVGTNAGDGHLRVATGMAPNNGLCQVAIQDPGGPDGGLVLPGGAIQMFRTKKEEAT